MLSTHWESDFYCHTSIAFIRRKKRTLCVGRIHRVCPAALTWIIFGVEHMLFWLNYVENICTPYIMRIVRGPCRTEPLNILSSSTWFRLLKAFKPSTVDLWTSRRKMWRKSLEIKGNDCFFLATIFILFPLNPKRKMRIHSIMAFVLGVFVSLRFGLMWLLNNENDVSIFRKL